MAAERTVAATIPEELIRQSGRVEEQLQCLYAILDKTNGRLSEMSSMMTNYSPDLVSQFNNLKTALESYKVKATNIYGEVSEGLLRYANDLLNNLTELDNSVQNIASSVQDL